MALSSLFLIRTELPFAWTVVLNLLLAAARASNASYMIAENYCYSRENLIISAMARHGVFGEMYFGEAEYVHEMKHDQ